MKSFTAIAFATTLMFAHSAYAADPVSELTTLAAAQIAEQAAELKQNLAVQLHQSLAQSLETSLADAVAEAPELKTEDVVAGLENSAAAIVE
jgi:hypothetical protein